MLSSNFINRRYIRLRRPIRKEYKTRLLSGRSVFIKGALNVLPISVKSDEGIINDECSNTSKVGEAP